MGSPIPPKETPQPLSQAAEMAMPPLIHKVTGTSNVSMDAAHPSSTVAARSQVDTSTVSDRANWAKPPNNALTLKRQTSWVLLVVVVLFWRDYCNFPGNRHKRNKNYGECINISQVLLEPLKKKTTTTTTTK